MQKFDENKGITTISVPAAYVAIASAIAALGLLVTLHGLSPEFSPAWRMISEYANGRYAWVLSLMFAAYGLATLALAWAIRSQASTRGGKVGLGFLIASGVGQAAASVFNLNLVTLHDLAGAFGIICLPIGAVLISRSLVTRPGWSAAKRPLLWMAHLTWITVVLFVASFPLMMATFVQAVGSLPSTAPSELPAGVIALVGWTDRLLVLAAWGWVSITAYHAILVSRSERSRAHGAARPVVSTTSVP